MNSKEANNIRNIILNVLDELINLYKGENIFTKDSDNQEFTLYKYKYNDPKNATRVFSIKIPKSINSRLNFKIKNNCYVVDVFNTFEKEKRIISPNDLYKFLINFDGYKNFLSSNIQFRNVNDLFVDRDLIIRVNEDEISDNNKESENILNEWANKEIVSPILLLGDRGMGKSWTIKNFCIRQYEKHIKNPWIEPVPVFLNLKIFSDSFHFKTSLFEAIIFQIKKIYGIKMLSDYYIWEAFIKTNRIIIVLDGLDEMSKEINFDLRYRHLWEIFNIADKTSKLIITSRTSYFNSLTDIYKHFSYNTYKKHVDKTKRIYSNIEAKFNRNFNIWSLKRFSEKELNLVSIKYINSKAQKLNNGIDRFNKLFDSSNESDKQILNEIKKLSYTPAFFNKLVFLSSIPNISFIEIYRKCLLYAAIDYNIVSKRALKSINEIKDDEISLIKFNAQIKLEILQELAWFMFERNQEEFELIKLPHYIKNIFGHNDEILINDIRTQTLIKLKDNNEFKFFSKGIFAFLIASHLISLLKKDIKKGIIDIGSYNIKNHTFLKDKITTFLAAFLENNINLKQNIYKEIERSLKVDKPFSPWHRYLFKNLKPILNDITNLEDQSSWNKVKSFDFIDELAIVPGNKKGIEPFLLSKTEITNEQYAEFLGNRDSITIDNVKYSSFGYFWKREKLLRSNPYSNIINAYHLFYWVNGELPKEQKKHPVVYISWFAAAAYCNWLSIREKIIPFYKFVTDKNNSFEKVIITNSNGYRLPTIDEWTIAAKDGNDNHIFPWDKFKDENNYLTEKGQKLMDDLLKRHSSTNEVKDDTANIYGIYGMMGNVREWADVDTTEKAVKSLAVIKGSTWLLGKDGFKYDDLNKIMAQNTNLDVGFRVAKSIDIDTKKKIKSIIN